jgi:hypothetical protein
MHSEFWGGSMLGQPSWNTEQMGKSLWDTYWENVFQEAKRL